MIEYVTVALKTLSTAPAIFARTLYYAFKMISGSYTYGLQFTLFVQCLLVPLQA